MSDPLEPIFEHIHRTPAPPGRPFVTLSYAQSLDGSIAREAGHRYALSGPESQAFTHRLRACHPSILVGIGAVLADDPQLTVRHATGEDPQPVVLDGALRFPLHAKLLSGKKLPWIAAAPTADPARAAALESLGVQVLSLPSSSEGRIDLLALLHRLHALGVRRVMVEGGARVIASFLQSRLIDFAALTISPCWLAGPRAVDGLGRGELPWLHQPQWAACGADMIVWGEPHWAKA